MAGGLTGAGYQGPPALTLARAVTSWRADLPAILAVLALAALYLAGMRRARRAGQRWPAGPAVAFLAGGLGTLVIATMSFLGVYQNVLFAARAAQTVVLLLVAPLFLVMGRPLSLAMAAAPWLRPRLTAAIGSPAARILTFPAITALVLVITPFLLYFTPWYQAGLASPAIAGLTHAALLCPGLVFFWTLLRVDPVPKAYPYLVGLWITAAEVVGDAVLGLAVLADQHLIAGGYYQALARPWGPGPRTDQVLGGGALWVLGDLVGLPFLAAQLIQMVREDAREAARTDAELDALAVPAGGAGAGGAGAASAAGAGAPAAPGRPWWESDSRFTGRFRRPGSP